MEITCTCRITLELTSRVHKFGKQITALHDIQEINFGKKYSVHVNITGN